MTASLSHASDSQRAFALWEDVTGHDSSISVRWVDNGSCDDAEYRVRVRCSDTTVDIDELETFLKAARAHGCRHVFVEGGALEMIL